METNLQAIGSERIHAYQTSGQTMKAWCAEQNLTVHQLKYWLYKAQRKRPASSAMIFRPDTVPPPSIHIPRFASHPNRGCANRGLLRF